MRIRLTMEVTVRMGNVFSSGNGLIGYMPDGTTYADLVRVFGRPQYGESGDNKTKAEWAGKINGLQFTIYDWKSPVDPKQNTDWHIGGQSEMTATLLVAYFKAAK
ncbi:MAG: hypothetical protein PHP45_04680 [Elusimicrobiales bacterium]|nr:hypothetical protein [Elusimicrobiales bacterium]